MTAVEQRFWRKVRRGPGCWIWTGRVDRGGYGAFSVSRREIVRAHRYSWTLAQGRPPVAACVLQRCGRRDCVNPGHLYLGSAHDQPREGYTRLPTYRPSAPRGDRHWTHRQADKVRRGAQSNLSKLDAAHVQRIRALYAEGRTASELALEFGVVPATILNIVRFRTWREAG